MFRILSILPVLLNFVTTLVKEAEALHKNGQEKKKVVLEGVKQFLTQMGVNPDKYLGIVSTVIDALVFFYNVAGVFEHTKN